jgi:tRNA-splicing ligase RtcB
MTLAGRYAYAGREWVARKVVSLLGARELELVHNHHNFAWQEEHDGEALVVVRKGATPAFPGQRGFVGGSMGDDAVIVQGVTVDRVADPARARAQRFRPSTGPGASCPGRRPLGSEIAAPGRCLPRAGSLPR